MAVAPPITDFRILCDQASDAAEQFSNIYYNTFDKQRHLLSKLYTNLSTVIWNGNAYHGQSKINEFFINLPGTAHELSTVDCQPVNQIASPDRTSVLVVCEGNVRYGDDRRRKYFTQNFLLMSDNNTWKIVTDNFRFIDVE